MAFFNRRTVVILAGVTALVLQGCATGGRERIVRDGRCADFSFQIYFEQQSAGVTSAADTVMTDAARQIQGCPEPAVEIVGLADFRGAPAPNLALSRQRAEAVAGALQRKGFAAPSFRVLAAGEAGAITPEGEAEPLRRRAEVFVRFPSQR
jgi:peptidoglycan-associated lipoprotein